MHIICSDVLIAINNHQAVGSVVVGAGNDMPIACISISAYHPLPIVYLMGGGCGQWIEVGFVELVMMDW